MFLQRRSFHGSIVWKVAGAAAFLALVAQNWERAWGQERLPFFNEVTELAGIHFKHSYGDNKMDNIVEGTGAGVCVLDFDNDGFLDLYFANGAWTRGVSNNMGRHLRNKLWNHLYRNNGDGTFTDVSFESGTADKDFTTGVTAADYDNDGDVDIYVLEYGRNKLYRNEGDGTFVDVARKAGLDNPRWSVHAVWFDYNRDGYLDVYVGNYLKYDSGRFRDFYPARGYPGPLSYSGQPDAMYRNNGNGTFTDVTKQLGMFLPDGRAMSVSVADLNNDGNLEIYVCNDAMENYCFVSTGDGHYEDRAIELGLAYGEHGQNVSSMGPAIGDVNRDGLLDVYVPDLSYCSLLIQKKFGFVHVTRRAGVAMTMAQYAGWGPVFFDYDNDGWLDIYTSHGHPHFEFVQEDTLMRNKRDGTFEDVSSVSGDYFQRKYVGRGASYFDYDDDGDVDLIVVNMNDLPNLLRNEGGNFKNWLKVEVCYQFDTGTRCAIGARVVVKSNGLEQIEEAVPARGFLSQGDPRLHFGLGTARSAEVEIRWPDGFTQTLVSVPANRTVRVVRRWRGVAKP